jgi:hypothetical protein
MKALVTFAFCALLLAATAAFADASAVSKPPRVYTGVHPPAGTKPSSFAPHPGGSKRHVYGAPIQGPIFKMQPKPKLKSTAAAAAAPRHP